MNHLEEFEDRLEFLETASNIAKTMFSTLKMVQIGQTENEVTMLFNTPMNINTTNNFVDFNIQSMYYIQ